MAGNASRRLAQELLMIHKEGEAANPLISVKPKAEDDLFNWEAILKGPEGSPYEGGRFQLAVEIPSEYPFKAPIIKYITKIYHPSIKKDDGSICGEVFSEWKPSIKIMDVLKDLLQMMGAPDSKSPLEPEIGRQLQENPAEFNKTAKEWTKKFAN
jgi:ubiquitin-protein ligase